jgi:hypothetical protein
MKIQNASNGSVVGGVVITDSEKPSCEERAEILRKKCRYRELILSGRLVLPHERAAQLLGPDCLYHLYSASEAGSRSKKKKRVR